mmetsp:Transcript_8040/g.16951  ORF Transcript_8040/g.16951 Transcript_8040/m.16951 type:complete len:944 (+) Transcript_8040:99-2930(+)
MEENDSLAVLPANMGKQALMPKAKVAPAKFIPKVRGGLLTENPNEEVCPYTFSDSPAYLRKKKEEEDAKRFQELEAKDETRGFLQSVEELGKKHKWEEAFNVLERRTAVPSGLFLVTRAVLRWKFCKYCGALRDVEEALKNYSSSAKAGPLAAAIGSFMRICIGSEARDKGSCTKEMRELVDLWEKAEQTTLERHALGKGLFHPRVVERLAEPCQVVEGMEAHDGSYVATTGLRIGYVLLKNQKDANAPVIVHFHGTSETAADYRGAALATKYRDLPVHLLVVDYRGYGWSGGEPSLSTFLRDAEPLAEKLPEIFVQNGMTWPYPGGLILSGRSVGAQVAVHLAALFPTLFRALMLDSAMSTSATGDRLGRATERAAALERWGEELEKASLEVLQPLAADLWGLSVLDKISSYDGQLLVMHGMEDEIVPYEGSESLHAAVAGTRRKELVLVEGAGHNDIGKFEAYWSAQRRFALKVQLDDALPSVGAKLEHLCVVCADKAVSKCGRCQKVWYCGRKHQAEHWKTHKNTCAGGPPEPKPKVEPDAEACLVAAVSAEVRSERDVAALAACLASAGAQEQPPQGLFLSWHAASQDLADQVTQVLKDLQAKQQPALAVTAKEAPSELARFEHVKVLAGMVTQEAPAHSWVALLEPGDLWSPRYSSLLVPALRRSAADPRVVAVRCGRCVRPKSTEKEAVQTVTAADVEASLSSGALELADGIGETPAPSEFAVRLKGLQAFVDSTPEPALKHELCTYRFNYKLTHTYGKKVQDFVPPEGEWMRWATPVAAALKAPAEEKPAETETETAPAVEKKPAEDLKGIVAVDWLLGRSLFAGAQYVANAKRGEAPAAETEGAEAPPVPGARLTTVKAAACAVAGLRRTVEQKLILHAGESMSAKDMRSLAMAPTDALLEELELDQVIGIQRWAKDAATTLYEAAATEFLVTAE